MTTSLSRDSDLYENRPSLCSICGAPAGALLFCNNRTKRYYGSCGKKHLEKIKQKIERGEKLSIRVGINYDSVDYSRLRNKDLFLELRQKNKSGDLVNWLPEDRKRFFNWIVLEYLNAEKAKADLPDEEK